MIFFASIFQQKFKYKMTNIKFVIGCSNFAQFSTIKNMQVAKKSLTQKTKNWGNNQVSRRFGRYSFLKWGKMIAIDFY